MSTSEADSQRTALKQNLENARRSIRHSIKSLDLLRTNTKSQDELTIKIPSLPIGLNEILSTLLSTLKHTVTALSLAFKPPITPDAAIQQIEKLSDQYTRIISCVLASGSNINSSLLVEEWTYGIEELGSELERLLFSFDGQLRGIDDEETIRNQVLSSTSTSSSVNHRDDVYLAHTGMVWDLIDRLSTLSINENQAVIKKWESQKEVVKDAWTEFKEFLEDQSDGSDVGNDDDSGVNGDIEDQDEWAELENALGGSQMTKEERNRAEAAKTLFGLHQILHATIPRFLPLLVTSPESSYRQLINVSNEFVAAFDTAISGMYPEQKEEEIELGVRNLNESSTSVVDAIEKRLQLTGLQAEKEKCDQCAIFLGKWKARLGVEVQHWEERKLSVNGLKDALPAVN